MENAEINNQETQNKKNEIRKNWIFVFLFADFIFLDQLVKFLVKDPFLNKNFAFSLPLPIAGIYLIYFLVIVVIIFHLKNNFFQMKMVHKFGWALVLAGGVSNIAERIILGSVRDFIYISWRNFTGIYNIADFYIILGVLILLVAQRFEE